MRKVLLLPVVLPLLLLSAEALADGDAVAQAKQRFNAAAQAYHEARYKDAIELFMQANALDPHADLLFNVGQAYEKLGEVPNALRSYRDYLRAAPGATDRGNVERTIANLEARLRERGVQQVTVFSTPAGATLQLDGKPVGQTPWTGEIAPGRHVAVLHASGYPDVAKEFVLVSERAMDLDIAMPVAATGAAATVIAGRAPEPPLAPAGDGGPQTVAPARPRTVAPWTFAALGVGVASLGASLGLELARKGAANSASSDPTQIGYASALGNASTYQTAARAMVGVGAVFTAGGVVLLAIDLKGPAGGATPKAAFGCFQGACGAVATGRF
jgi:tetratricopeptide (TPR) repeat protein